MVLLEFLLRLLGHFRFTGSVGGLVARSYRHLKSNLLDLLQLNVLTYSVDHVQVLRYLEILWRELVKIASIVVFHDFLELVVKAEFTHVALALDANGKCDDVAAVLEAGCDAPAEAVNLTVFTGRFDDRAVLLDLPHEAVHDWRVFADEALAGIAVFICPLLVNDACV